MAQPYTRAEYYGDTDLSMLFEGLSQAEGAGGKQPGCGKGREGSDGEVSGRCKRQEELRNA